MTPLTARSPAAEGRLSLVIAGAGIAVGALMLAMVVRYASYTFAYDYRAYDDAARRVFAGAPLYDLSFSEAGPLGLFLYPPTAILPFLPFALLPQELARWIWIGVDIVAVLGAIALLPVRPRTRSLVLLLASISWPVLFSIKVGQVGPVLLLAFAAGWRWLDRPAVVGFCCAFGAALKVQPLTLLAWILLTRRWRAFTIAVGVLGVTAILATVIAGPGSWVDFVTIITRVSDPILTPSNFTPGATAYALGLPIEVARALQFGSTIAIVAAIVVSSRLLSSEASYLVTVVASQLLSPLLWDHYALMLLLPVAWLLDRRKWWAALMPLSQSAMLVGLTPPIAYVAAWTLAMISLLVLGRRTSPGALVSLRLDPA